MYFTYSGQAGRLVEVIDGALTARGCDVTKAGIEFTDCPLHEATDEDPAAPPGVGVRQHAAGPGAARDG